MKELAIERMTRTLDMLKSLPSESFRLSDWVTRWEDGCGTVCCIAGWYPKYIPEAGLTWGKSSNKPVALLTKEKSSDLSNLLLALANWHMVNERLVRVIFLPSSMYKVPDYPIVLSYQDNTKLTDAIKMIETVILLMQNDIIKIEEV